VAAAVRARGVAVRVPAGWYDRDVLVVAPELVGLVICHLVDAEVRRGRITEAEAYRGEDDTACHARFGCTARTEVLYRAGGVAYVYLCYGIHHLFNVVTGSAGEPQAALVRGVEGAYGPGRATKALGVTTGDNRTDLRASDVLWLEDDGYRPEVVAAPRIGIGYAGTADQARLWRFTAAGVGRFGAPGPRG